MIETITKYCLDNRLSFDLSYFAKNWMIKFDNSSFSTGWCGGVQDLSIAFEEAKKKYENRKN